MFKIGDRVTTRDGKTITVAGVLQVRGYVGRASEMKMAGPPPHEHQHGEDQTAASQTAASSFEATTDVGDVIIWGT